MIKIGVIYENSLFLFLK